MLASRVYCAMKGRKRETVERHMLPTNLSESTVVTAALDWLAGFGGVVARGRDISPDGPAPEHP